MTACHSQTFVPDLAANSICTSDRRGFRGRRPGTHAVPEHHAQRFVSVPPAAMPDDGLRLEDARPPGARHAPGHVAVLGRRESSTGPELVVETGDVLECAPTAREVCAVPETGRVAAGVDAVCPRRGLRRQALAGAFRQHLPEDVADRCVGERALDGRGPIRGGCAVIVGERDDRTRRGAPAEIACPAETRSRSAYDVRPGFGRCDAEACVDRCRVHDDELVVRAQHTGDGAECGAQELDAVAGADHDADAITVACVRALVVSAWAPWWLTDGSVWVLHHHLRFLADRHDVAVLAAGAPAAESPVPTEVQNLPGAVDTRWFGRSSSASVDYARRWVRARRTGEPMHVGYVERSALLRAMREQIATQRPDVVHAFGWGTAGLWRYADGVPVVHVAVDAWSSNATNRLVPSWRQLADRGELDRIRAHEQQHYPQDAAVVVVAPTDADDVRAVAPAARVEVVANGVDAGPEPEARPAAPVLGFHGSFEARHNIDAARELVRVVLPRVRRAVPDVKVLLIGRNPGPEVRSLVRPGVELRADVGDARAELRDVAVYVAPLVSGTGLKNKVLEAMAAGRPVVTTPKGAAGIGAGGGVTVADDVAGVADAVVALLADPAQVAADGIAARQRVVAEFTWDKSAHRIEQLWQEASRP
jgi:polysaccharide biosynthesis protein PslH